MHLMHTKSTKKWFERRHEKNGFSPMRKQRRRSASQ